MDEELTLGKKLDKILEVMEDKKQKKFSMPFMVRLFSGKTRRQNFAIVCFIRTNGATAFRMVKIEDDTIKVGEYIYDASAENMLRYKRKPLLIIKEWDMTPFSPKESVIEASKAGTLTAAQKLILTKMKMESIKPSMQLNLKLILVLLAAGAGVLWLLTYLKVI